MKLVRLVAFSLLGLGLATSSLSALAAAAVASNGSYSYTITDAASKAGAEREALEECSRRVNGCTVLISFADAGAIAIASGDQGVQAASDPNPELARKNAMDGCRKNYKNCTFSALYWEPGGNWASFATAKGSAGDTVASMFLTHGATQEGVERDAIKACEHDSEGVKRYQCEALTHFGNWVYVQAKSPSYLAMSVRTTEAEAKAEALHICRTNSPPGATCEIVKKVVNPGTRPKPASFARVAALVAKSRMTPAPVPATRVTTRAVQHLTCSNQCVNGSCVRTFPDGRKERWQAPRVFDPFANDWKWKTDSCGN